MAILQPLDACLLSTPEQEALATIRLTLAEKNQDRELRQRAIGNLQRAVSIRKSVLQVRI